MLGDQLIIKLVGLGALLCGYCNIHDYCWTIIWFSDAVVGINLVNIIISEY